MRLQYNFKIHLARELSYQATIDSTQGLIHPILGPSGCGKTTLLRVLSGSLTPTSGVVSWSPSVTDPSSSFKGVWYDSARKINLPPQKRQVGFVPQDSGLFPHLTVLENVRYSDTTFLAWLGGAQPSSRVMECLESCGLTQLANRLPRQLSGGQKQRTALARALFSKPTLLLLDEPLSSLDSWARKSLRNLLIEKIRDDQILTLWITHDEEEANWLDLNGAAPPRIMKQT